MKMQGRAHAYGMTLVEMLVVLTLAITLSVGAPSMSRLIDSLRLTSSANSLFAALMMARSEAAKRHTRVVLCKSDNGMSCTKAGGGWEQGWIIFQDSNNNATVDIGEAIISHEQTTGSSLRVLGNLPVGNYVSYAPDGRTQYTSGAFQAGKFTICMHSTNTAEARTIVISASGRPRTTTTTVAICV